MDIVTIILSAAKTVGVSGSLLVAICSHESGGFKHNFAPMDHGSPSFGSCQVKFETVKMLGFTGLPVELMDPKVNAIYAAKYLKFQQSRYGEDDWTMLAAAYNAGSYLESHRKIGCPKNMGYVKLVQNQLPEELKYKLNCGDEEASNN
jgi:soluble lytic murein transglycosylase-like protein